MMACIQRMTAGGTGDGANLRYDAELAGLRATHHRVTLAGAGLTVGEDTDVVSFNGVLQHLNTNVFIDELLTSELCVTRLQQQTNITTTTIIIIVTIIIIIISR